MPLVMITGYPSSGKTTRAQELKKLLEERIAAEAKAGTEYAKIKVEIVNDEMLNIPKENYRNAFTEKMLRGTQSSAVKRLLSKSTIVILDNLTYIKGFRYQLYCEAKALQTTSCVMHVGAPAETCKNWNKSRDTADGWAEDLFDALVFRYEEPNGMSRWDSPLFTLPYTESVPINDIWDVLVMRAPPPPNRATVLDASKPANYMTELDKVTIKVLNDVMERYKDSPGSSVQFDGYPGKVQLPLRLTLPQMNRYRRNFVTLNKMHPTEVSRIEGLFIDFLIRNWEEES